jgi:hypothetical protein
MSSQILGKSAKLDAKKRAAFLKMTAGSNLSQLETERATSHNLESTVTKSHPRPSDG